MVNSIIRSLIVVFVPTLLVMTAVKTGYDISTSNNAGNDGGSKNNSLKDDEKKYELKLIFSYLNQEDYIIQETPSSRYTDEKTGLQYTGWGIYEDIMFPGTTILWGLEHSKAPQKSTNVLKCSITGGDKYNNIFFTNTPAMKWKGNTWDYSEASVLVMEMDFYIDGTVDCNVPNNSQLEGIEFCWQNHIIPNTGLFCTQWSKGGEWRYWRDDKNPETNRPYAWISFKTPLYQCVKQKKWNTIRVEAELLPDKKVRYLSLELDGVKTTFEKEVSIPQGISPTQYAENYLQVGFQINGNTAVDKSHGFGVDPIDVYLDSVNLYGYKKSELN